MSRAREIVAKAASMVISNQPHQWLLMDECGTFESMATESLAKTKTRADVLQLSEDQVNLQIAMKIALFALDTFIAARSK